MLGIFNRTVVSFFVFLILSHQRVTQVSYEKIYDCENSTKMFQYLADPRNYKVINPTVINMEVNSSDKSAISVIYTEHLVQLPFIKNRIHATYWPSISNGIIRSQHNTTFFGDWYTIPTDAILKISQELGGKTKYTENVTYTCPWILSTFCLNELNLQRRLIMDNLERVFKNNTTLI